MIGLSPKAHQSDPEPDLHERETKQKHKALWHLTKTKGPWRVALILVPMRGRLFQDHPECQHTGSMLLQRKLPQLAHLRRADRQAKPRKFSKAFFGWTSADDVDDSTEGRNCVECEVEDSRKPQSRAASASC